MKHVAYALTIQYVTHSERNYHFAFKFFFQNHDKTNLTILDCYKGLKLGCHKTSYYSIQYLHEDLVN